MKKVSLILAAVIAFSSLSVFSGCGGSSEKTAEVTTAVTTKATRITTEAATTDDEEEKNRKVVELRNAVYEIGIEAFNDSTKYRDSTNLATECITKDNNVSWGKFTITLKSQPTYKSGDDSRHILNACDEMNRALDIPYTVTQELREKCREEDDHLRETDFYSYWYDYEEIHIQIKYTYSSYCGFKVEYEFMCF